MDTWKRGLGDIIPKNKEAIIIGDYNATNRHGALNLINSHEYLPGLKRGTRGLFSPQSFRTTIDYIYLLQNTYQVKNTELFDFEGPDHIGIFLKLVENS